MRENNDHPLAVAWWVILNSLDLSFVFLQDFARAIVGPSLAKILYPVQLVISLQCIFLMTVSFLHTNNFLS